MQDSNLTPIENPAAVKKLNRWTAIFQTIHCRIGGMAIPSNLWGRIILLFGAFLILKTIMVVNFRRHIFETYWREDPALIGWSNHAAFLVFVSLVGMIIWKLARMYETKAIRDARFLNGIVLILAAIFICLSFHEGDKGHLHPLMTGLFKWSDLLPYYNLNLFFRPPFLAGWVVGYAALYYVLARTGRERFAMRATALLGAAFTFLCLRDLINLGEELIIADAIGIICLLFLRRGGVALKWYWLFLPFALIAAAYCAWASYADALSTLQSEIVVMFGMTAVLFWGLSLLAWRRGVYSGWSWVAMFGGVSFLLFLNVNYPSATNYRNLMCVVLTLPRYFMGEFGVSLMMLAVGMIYLRKRPQGSLVWLDFCNIGLLLLASVDLQISQIMATRLDWDLMSLGLGEGVNMMWRLAKPYLPIVSALLIAVVGGYFLAMRGTVRLIGGEHRDNWQRFGFGQVVLIFVLLGLAGRIGLGNDKVVGQTVEVFARSAPLGRMSGNNLLAAEDFKRRIQDLHMQSLLTPAEPELRSGGPRDLNVVFILLESTFNKHLSLFNGTMETQPLLSKYRDRMELFPNFYSSFAGSINARFACYSGLYPVGDHKEFTTQRVPVKTLFEILHEHGWANSVFYSSHYDYTNFRDFLRGRNIAEMYDAETMPGVRTTKPVSWGLREEETLAAMQTHIRKCAQTKQRFFMSYIPAAPHYPYDGTPERFRKFHPKEFKDFTEYYLNDLLYMDWIVASVLDELKQNGLLEKTLVVITGDHGEMLGAGGGAAGHGWELTPELANVPLIIMDPAKRNGELNYTIGSHVDLLPTILSKLGLDVPAGQMYQGASLYSNESVQERTIYLNSFSKYAVVQGQKMFFGERGNDRIRTEYLIENSGSRTRYVETPILSQDIIDISAFDGFQASFLRNYSHYCGTLLPSDGGVQRVVDRHSVAGAGQRAESR